jgi:predicted DNA-binding transcriptional regulator YafY
MAAVGAEEGTAPPPADFDLGAFAARSFGIYQDAVEDVVLKVAPGEKAEEARAWRWHPTQTLEDAPDGGVIVRFTASGMRELAWHLFTWSGAVTILAPERLKQVMAEELAVARAALAPQG